MVTQAAYYPVYALEFFPTEGSETFLITNTAYYENDAAINSNETSTVINFGDNESLLVTNSTVGLNVDFEVVSTSPNGIGSYSKQTARFRLYNPTNETSYNLQKAGLITFKAGYNDLSQNNVFPIFQGTLENTEYGMAGSDKFIDLTCVTGQTTLASKWFEKSYKKGVRKFTIINDIFDKIRQDYFAKVPTEDLSKIEFIGDWRVEDFVYQTGQYFAGDALDVLAKILPDFKVTFNSHGVQLTQRINRSDYLKEQVNVYHLSKDYGVITVQYTNSKGVKLDKNYTGITVDMVLNNTIKLTDVITLPIDEQNNIAFDVIQNPLEKREKQYFKVIEVIHSGMTWGGEFRTRLVGELINTPKTTTTRGIDYNQSSTQFA